MKNPMAVNQGLESTRGKLTPDDLDGSVELSLNMQNKLLENWKDLNFVVTKEDPCHP